MSYRKIETSGIEKLIEENHISSLLAKIIKSFDYNEQQVASFFHPVNEFDYDSDSYQIIKDLLMKIKQKQEKVFIFGDYDCDGICATASMKIILDYLGIPNGFYIPNRLSEGYGLNLSRLIQAYEKGYKVLVTVDNGVSAIDGLKWAKEHNMKVIVTDHHVIDREVICDALLHPSVLSSAYKSLCGSGVVYMLANYLGIKDKRLKVLAMLATISDVMNLDGINIKIVNEGLKELNNHEYFNVERLLDNPVFPLSEEDISFQIVPKINAVGRVSDKEVSQANVVVHYLLSNNPVLIEQIANDVIIKLNNHRKALSLQQYELVKEKIDPKAKYNVIYQDGLHIGIIGLLATRLQATTNKLSFVLTNKDDNIIISGRSNNKINVIELLADFKDKTLNFGGHPGACGLTIQREHLNDFLTYLEDKCSNCDFEGEFSYIDVDLDELTLANIKEVFSYRPYGQFRKLPYFKIKMNSYDNYTMLKNDHQLKWNNKDIDFISFNNEGYYHYLDKEVTVIGTLSENKFRNKVAYQIKIKEIL